MSDVPNSSTTQRGLTIYDQFTDRYGIEIRVQESSLAAEPCVWIFALDCDGKDSSAHLTVDQARRVCAALNTWLIEHGE